MTETLRAPQSTDTVYDAIFSRETVGIFQEFGIRRAYLFGSYARRDETSESDVDFLVERDTPFDLDTYMDLKDALETRFQTRVDLVPRNSVRKFAKSEIEREKIAIFENANE